MGVSAKPRRQPRELGSAVVRSYSDQIDSAGASMEEIVECALSAAQPERGLSWLDIGCGRGDLLRRIRDEWQPAELHGIDPIDWLDPELRADVEFHTIAAEDADELPTVDRVLLVEVIEHLEAPWTALRKAARLVAPGGRIVLSTPNLATLRNRLELGLRGHLTSFRPDYQPHVSPALPHVSARILTEEGLEVEPAVFAGSDVISMSGGRVWPATIRRRYPRLTSVSIAIAAARPLGEPAGGTSDR
jgi:SAM-dependent methyltransferase